MSFQSMKDKAADAVEGMESEGMTVVLVHHADGTLEIISDLESDMQTLGFLCTISISLAFNGIDLGTDLGAES